MSYKKSKYIPVISVWIGAIIFCYVSKCMNVASVYSTPLSAGAWLTLSEEMNDQPVLSMKALHSSAELSFNRSFYLKKVFKAMENKGKISEASYVATRIIDIDNKELLPIYKAYYPHIGFIDFIRNILPENSVYDGRSKEFYMAQLMLSGVFENYPATMLALWVNLDKESRNRLIDEGALSNAQLKLVRSGSNETTTAIATAYPNHFAYYRGSRVVKFNYADWKRPFCWVLNEQAKMISDNTNGLSIRFTPSASLRQAQWSCYIPIKVRNETKAQLISKWSGSNIPDDSLVKVSMEIYSNQHRVVTKKLQKTGVWNDDRLIETFHFNKDTTGLVINIRMLLGASANREVNIEFDEFILSDDIL